MNTQSIITIFDMTLSAGLRASILVLFVLLIRKLLWKQLPAGWRYALWLPVLAALLIPALPVLPTSLMPSLPTFLNAQSSKEQLFTDSVTDEPELFGTGKSDTARLATSEGAFQTTEVSSLSGTAVEVLETDQASGSISWIGVKKLICWIWFSGVVVAGFFLGVSYFLTMHHINQSTVRVSSAFSEKVDVLAKRLGLRTPPSILMSSAVSSPAVCGLLRPKLLINRTFEQQLSEEEQEMILLHELTHIRRGDLLINALQCGLLVLHWYNPVLYIAFSQVRADREAACDETVLRCETGSRRTAYGRTLLKLEAGISQTGLCLGFVGLLHGERELRLRIKTLLLGRTLNRGAATLLTAGILTASMVGIAADDDREFEGNEKVHEASNRRIEEKRVLSFGTRTLSIVDNPEALDSLERSKLPNDKPSVSFVSGKEAYNLSLEVIHGHDYLNLNGQHYFLREEYKSIQLVYGQVKVGGQILDSAEKKFPKWTSENMNPASLQGSWKGSAGKTQLVGRDDLSGVMVNAFHIVKMDIKGESLTIGLRPKSDFPYESVSHTFRMVVSKQENDGPAIDLYDTKGVLVGRGIYKLDETHEVVKHLRIRLSTNIFTDPVMGFQGINYERVEAKVQGNHLRPQSDWYSWQKNLGFSEYSFLNMRPKKNE